MAPDGSLVVSTIGDDKVYRAPPNGIGGFLPPVAIASGLFNPTNVAVGPDGSVYVADTGNRVVRRIAPNLAVTIFAGNGTVSGTPPVGGLATGLGLNQVSDVAVAPNGTVYMGGEIFHSVARVTADGIYRGAWGTGDSLVEGVPIVGSGVFANIEGLASGPDGSIYYIDWRALTAGGQYVVRQVDPSGIVRTLSAGVGSATGSDGSPALSRGPTLPRALAVEPDGSVLVATQSSIYRLTDPLSQASDACGSSATQHFVPSGDEGYCFDGKGNHLRTVDLRTGQALLTFAYNGIGQLTSVTDAAGLVTTIDPVLATESTLGHYEITAPHGQKTTLSFTSANFNAHEIRDALATTSLSPRVDGLLTGLTDARGVSFSFGFGADGRLLSDTSPLGTQLLTRSALPTGYEVLHKTPLGRETRYSVTKPGAGTLQVRTNPDGTQNTIQTLLSGGTVTTSADGTRTTTTLDSDPRFGLRLSYPASRTVSLPTPGPASGALSLTTTETRATRTFNAATQKWQELTTTTRGSLPPTQVLRSYDSSGQTFTTTSPAGRITTRVTDAAGRTVQLRVGDLTPTVFAYEDGQLQSTTQGDRSTSLDYTPLVEGGMPQDDAGFVERITDALGHRTEFDRDLYGRVLKQWEAEGTAHEALTELAWDPNGNLERVTPPVRPAHDLAYNAINGLAAYSPPTLGSVPFPTTTYDVTADREPSLASFPGGGSVSRQYAPITGHLTSSLTIPSDPTLPSALTQYTYYATNDPPTGKAAGRVSSIVGPYGVNLAFQYYGFLTTRETWSGSVSGSVDFEYNNLFLRKRERVTPPTGAASSWFFGYDADSLITCVSANSTATCSPPAATDLYLARSPQHGQVTDLTAGNVSEHLEYSDTSPDAGSSDQDGPENRAFGELRSQRVTYGTNALMELTYDAPTKRRDPLGRIRFKSETLPGIASPCSGQTVDWEYEYDPRSRIENVYRCGVLHENFVYDPNNNITAHTTAGAETTATYDDQDRLLSRTSPGGITTYTYGANGELRSKTENGQTTTYGYDALGNLLTVQRPGGLPLITYFVDAMGRRVGKMVGSTITRRWLYRDTLKPVAEFDTAGNLLARYVYGSRTSTPELVVRAGKTYRLISDHLGSPRMVANISDPLDVPYRADYSAFGVVTPAQGYAVDSLDWLVFGFAGGIYDRDTGLVRFGARDYDPSVGRWISKDPIGFDGGQTNLYVYVADDPVGQTDAAGTGPLDLLGCILGGGSLSGCLSDERDRICNGAAGEALCGPPPSMPQCREGPCPPCPEPPAREEHYDHPHYPCGAHWHYFVYNQNPNSCQCFLQRRFGGCL